MNGYGRALGSLLLLALSGLVAAAVEAAQIDPAAAWSQYRRAETGRDPALKFPYEHCFRSAAATHDLPVSLLETGAEGLHQVLGGPGGLDQDVLRRLRVDELPVSPGGGVGSGGQSL